MATNLVFASCDPSLSYCTFVLLKGKNKGCMCMKEAFASNLFGRIVPACQHHIEKYEQLFFTQADALAEEAPAEEAAAEEDVVFMGEVVAETKSKGKRSSAATPALSLDGIPKAIDRATDCSICFEEGENIVPLLLPCGHTVCFSCMNAMLQKRVKGKCPVCRAVFKKTDLRRL